MIMNGTYSAAPLVAELLVKRGAASGNRTPDLLTRWPTPSHSLVLSGVSSMVWTYLPGRPPGQAVSA
jgi:hypothetical protein